MRKLFSAATAVLIAPFVALTLLFSAPAFGQQSGQGDVPMPSGLWWLGSTAWLPVSASNPLPVSGTFSASLSGFQPSASGARGTPFTVNTSDSSQTAPSGAVVVVSNVGATNPMYCNANAVAATTADQYISPNGGWFAFTMPSGVTVIHCIATGASTTANMVGGSGLPTGTGGGSGGGGGGGTVTQGTAGSAGSAWYVQPGTSAVFAISASALPLPTGAATQTTLASVLSALGSPFQAAGSITNITGTVSLPTGASTAANQSTEISSLATIASNTGAAIPAGSNLIGAVNLSASATGGATPYHYLSAVSNNSTSVKSSPGTLYDLTITQTTTTLGDLRLYDSATAPTCSSATGVVNNYAVQSNATSPGFHLTFPGGKLFANGISFCLTGAVADNDNTNFTTGVLLNMDYK